MIRFFSFMILLLCLSFWQLSAQCPPGDVALSTQAEVDAFLFDYPNCTAITGNLLIPSESTDITDISDLSPLSKLSSVGGNIRIKSNPNLSSLSGLDALTHVGGNLIIWANSSLTSLTGLNALTSAEKRLTIWENSSLISLSGLGALSSVGSLNIARNSSLDRLSGLNALSSIGGDMAIWENNSLSSLKGLDALSSIGGSMFIFENEALTSMSGLDALSSTGEYVHIGSNKSLVSLSGLDALTFVGGYLNIFEHPSLVSLSGIDALTSVGGDLRIVGNTSLSSLSGLENINPAGITNLSIGNNLQLSVCEVESICTYLGVETNGAIISDNATGCADRMEVEMACMSIAVGDLCTDAIDMNYLLGQAVGIPQTSTLLDNSNNTDADSPISGFECHYEMDPIQHNLWLLFTGDGNTYRFSTTQCSATIDSYIPNGDTQIALYSGTCSMLNAEACSEDISANNLSAEIDQFPTVAGTDYFLLLDGYNGQTGEFCLEVTRQEAVSTTQLNGTNINIFPNPVSDRLTIQLEGLPIGKGQLKLYNIQGQIVTQQPFNQTVESWSAQLDLSALPAAVYTVQLTTAEGQLTRRIVKE